MPLSASKQGLTQAIKQAFLSMNNSGAQDESNPESNIDSLASSLADAIHDYVSSANVDITSVSSIVPPGVAVATSGSPAAQTGATVAPGTAEHAGFGRLL